MCGIFAYIGTKKNAGDLIVDGLKSLEYRGYDSWGVAVKKLDSNIYIEKHTGKIGQAKLPRLESSIGIGHTRWATHGGVTEKNSHPHCGCTNDIIVVHNGIVENFSEIKKTLLKKKHRFISETDTEIIAHLIEEKLKSQKDRKQAVLKTFRELSGLNAIIIFFPKQEEFYAVKNGSPIAFGENEKEMIIASDAASIIPYTKSVYFLDDNELLFISKQGKRELVSTDGKEKKIKFITLNYSVQQAGLGRFPHFMIKEINEQPKVIMNIVDSQRKIIENAASLIKKSYGSYLVGCGSSYYACLAGTYLFSKIAKRHINASSGSEFSYLIDFLKNKSLVIALSQSGETIDVINSIKESKKKQAKVMAVTNVLGSTLYRMADYKILLNAGPEKCVVSTKVFTAKVAVLYLISYALNGGYDKGIAEIKSATKEIEKLITSKQLKELAQRLKDKNHIYTLGRGVSYPVALESALKIKEVSYIHAEGFAGGELKHGVIALIEKGTPIIIYNPEDETYEDTISSAYEVKARGAYIIGVSSKSSPVFDEFIKVKNCNDATSLPNVVVAQLLGYYLALAKGNDPDKPRNLAKSVTVK